MTDIGDIVDLDRWPIQGDASDLVARCQAELARDGMFNLSGFLRPGVAASIAQALEPAFESAAFKHRRRHNIYFRKTIPDLPGDHGALQEMETSNSTLCADQLAGPLTDLYRWPAFASFLAQVMGMNALYPMEDPLAAVNVMRYGEGEALNWHFDRSEFTTTLLLQAPRVGGAFEYRAGLRTEDDPNYDGVAKLIAGQDPAVQKADLTAGTLNVFRGKNTAHRVTPPKGDVTRIIAVFSFFDRPGVVFSDQERIGFYGRAG
ncbi:MAG: 2OG-Fe(II) oxygenase [Pseudomonadota bacterium]